ncbi:MAG TPA: VCBS repeat-containing protein, partial [Pirellulales bacterium]|nr:VCBS repeat-containing protein [Pirellulales bacterium]
MLTFLAPVDYATAGYPAGGPFSAVAAGDFANNGIRDLAVAGYSSVSVLLGNGDGTFQQAHTYDTGGINTASVAVGDLTGDGKLDIVTANDGYGYDGGYHYFPAVPGSVSVLMGNGDGTFQAPLNITLPGVGSPVSVALGDMNHDGRLDAVVTVATSSGYDYVDVLLGHGDGTFSIGSTTQLGFYGAQSVELGDFSGDGNLDVATVDPGANDVAVLKGNSDGTLAAPTYFATGAAPQSLAVGDVNGDGKLDLVTANYNYGNLSGNGGSVSVLLGNGDGSFQPPDNIALPPWTPPGYSGVNPLPLAQSPRAVVMGDLNGDGKMDLAVTATSSYSRYIGSGYYGIKNYAFITKSTVNVLLGNGDGNFTEAQIVPLDTVNSPASIVAGNFNGDNFPDLAVEDSNSGSVSVLMNAADWSPPTPPPSGFSVSGFPSSITAGVPGNFTVTALNADGTVDTAYTGTVSFTSSDGQAALPGVYQFTSGDAGVHTFSATLKTAGTQSITASYGTATGSETQISVTPAGA